MCVLIISASWLKLNETLYSRGEKESQFTSKFAKLFLPLTLSADDKNNFYGLSDKIVKIDIKLCNYSVHDRNILVFYIFIIQCQN